VYSDFDHPSDLVRVSLEDGTITRLFSHNSWVQEKSCGQTVNFQVPSLDGKAVLDGWIVKPADTKKAETAAKAKKEASAESAEILEAAAEEAEILEEAAEEKVPVVLLIHGGPLLAYQDAFTMEAQLLASAGFAVILANPRGSSCYGKSYASYESAFDGTAATDLLYYMDRALDAYPWMDRERLGVAGGSYGGYMSAWLAGHCDRFKAAVVMRGLLSFQYLYLISQAAGAPGMYEETEAFADLLMKIVRESPNTYAENMNIPMLIMHGEKDVNCPVEGAYQLYAGVKDTHPDLPVKLILFPNTGHGISSGRLDYYERYEQELVDWMQRYL
jgi:dipeptidyl aminopeptidase/acylaminoacyl peptidase